MTNDSREKTMSEIRMSGITGIVTGCKDTLFRIIDLLAEGHATIQEYLHQSQGAATTELHRRQAAVCEQLRNCIVRPHSVYAIQHQMDTVLTAGTLTALEHAHHQLTTAIHQEQHAIMHDLIVPQVSSTTAAIGFENVLQLPRPDGILLLGENDCGQALQHELIAAPNQPLTLRSETLGFNDDTCSKVLDDFAHELHKRGVITEPTSRTSTRRHTIRAHHQAVRRHQ